MNDFRIVEFIFFYWALMSGLITIAGSFAYIKRQIPPNSGFRGLGTKKTMSDERLWYAANEYMGKQMYKAGFWIIALAITIFIFKNRLSDVLVIIVLFAAILLPVAIALIKSLIHLRKL